MNETCCVCGQPLVAHFLELRSGVAHTGVYEGNAQRHCSAVEGDRQYTLGQIAMLRTIVRSLRYMAGRRRTRGDETSAAALIDYSYKVEASRDKMIRNLAQWYPWKKVNEP